MTDTIAAGGGSALMTVDEKFRFSRGLRRHHIERMRLFLPANGPNPCNLCGVQLGFAADALTEDFRQLEPNLKVEFNYAGSQTLWRQIEHGAPADLFLSADLEHLTALKRQGFGSENW